MPQDPSEQAQEEKHEPLEHRKKTLTEKMDEIQLDAAEDDTRAKATGMKLPYINLLGFPIGPEVLGMVTEEEARAKKCIPFFRYEHLIRVGAVDPQSEGTKQLIKRMHTEHEGADISVYLISQNSFDKAVALYKNVAKIKEIQYGVKITAEQLERYRKELTSHDVFQERIKESNMTEVFAIIISMAMNLGSSDIHIQAEEKEAVIRFRIDGVLTDVGRISPQELLRMANRIKGIAGLKINVTQVPQDGRITIELAKEDKLDIRVSTLPSAFGESVVMRLLRSSSIGLTLEQLGMRHRIHMLLKREIEKPNGMIITTGPTGSGKTTTLYAILNTLNTGENKIITLENPVEYKLPGIVQSQVDPAKNYTFPDGLRAILRQDPDIVMVGEIRDLETAKTAVDAALTGHLMLSTVHTNDAAGAVPRLIGMGVRGIFVAPALNAVIGQRLVRLICEHCKEAYQPAAEELAKAKGWIELIPENAEEQKPDMTTVKWYKGKGCNACNNTGYKGRIGIYELFTQTPEIEQSIISEQISEHSMKELLRKEGMITMGQDGVLKAIEGKTTLDEVFRVAKE